MYYASRNKPFKRMTEAAQKENPPTEELQTANEQVETDAIAGQLKQQAEEIVKLKDQYLRAMAETENVRARARREIEDSSKYAATKFARDMVGVVENLQRASASITPETRADNEALKQIGDGIDMTMQELLTIFERHGIKRLNPEGEKFDHNFHQAVAQVESKDVPAGNIVQVLQAGYIMHDRLLKPAMVTVATAQSSPADAPA